jgi:hypothetical protein
LLPSVPLFEKKKKKKKKKMMMMMMKEEEEEEEKVAQTSSRVQSALNILLRQRAIIFSTVSPQTSCVLILKWDCRC